MYYSLNTEETVTCEMFGRMMQKNGWRNTNPRRLACNLCVFIIDGSAEFIVEHTLHNVATGDILMIPAGALYSANTKDFCEYYFFRFSGTFTPCSTPPLYANQPRSFSFILSVVTNRHICFPQQVSLQEDFNKIYSCVLACTEHSANGTQAGRLILDAKLLEILLLLGERTERDHHIQPFPAVLEKMLVHIKKNLTKPIRAAEVCAHCCISGAYAAKLFKTYLNTTMTEYINSEKLSYARELMGNTDMNISEIAAYLGYCDVFYFSKRFKQKFGKSPSKMFSTTEIPGHE